MAAFRKFDPYTFLTDRERGGAPSEAAAEASETLAALVALAALTGEHPQNAKAIGDRTGILATLANLAAAQSQKDENERSGPTVAKAAKAANLSAADIPGAAEGLGAARSGPTPAKAAKPAKPCAANVQRNADKERGAIIEHDDGVPRSWAEGFARLQPDRSPGDVPPRRWQTFIDDCGRFLDGGWAPKAAALGWGPLDLFGANRNKPFARIDHAGLLWLLNGDKLIELDRHKAAIERCTGARQTHRRKPAAVGDVVPAWELTGG
jgi:hypothetical protein